MKKQGRKEAVYTLIELLMTIAIIIMLAALLLPSLARAKSKAKEIICLGNQKQCGVALISYAGDNGGIFPNPEGSDGSGLWRFWPGQLVYLGYFKKTEAYRCPAGPNPDPSRYDIAYGLVAKFTSYRPFQPKRMEAVPNPSQQLLLGDSAFGRVSLGADNQCYGICSGYTDVLFACLRHNRRLNGYFLDGSASSFDKNRLFDLGQTKYVENGVIF